MMLDIPLHCIYHVQTWYETVSMVLLVLHPNSSKKKKKTSQHRNVLQMSCNDRCNLPDQLSTWFYMSPFRADWSNNGKVPPNSTELQDCLTSGPTFACFRWVSLPSFTLNFEIQVFLGEPQSGRSFLSFLNCLKNNEDEWSDSRKKKVWITELGSKRVRQ